MMLPVPTGGTCETLKARRKSYTSVSGAGFPYAAWIMSKGRLKRPFRMLCVPASSELRADTRVAFPQPVTKVRLDVEFEKEVGTLTSVLHRMQASLWENSHLSGCQRLAHHTCTVLVNHICIGSSGNSDDEVGSSGMVVRRKHSTWSEIEHGQGHSSAHHCRESCCVGIDDGTRRVSVGWLGSEVEDPVAVR